MRPALLAIASACLLLAGSARAGDQIIDIHLTDKVVPGKKPALTITAFADLAELKLNLKRDDGKRVDIEKTNIPRNAKRTFELPQTKGRHRYRGTLKVTLMAGGGGSMNLDFTAIVIPLLGLAVRQDDLDLEAHKLTLRAKRPISRVDYEIVSDTGAVLGNGSHEYPRPASVVELAWEQKPGEVLRIALTGHDQDGITQDLALFPLNYSIPHEELVFETGKWDVLPSEAPKLDKSYKLLQECLHKYAEALHEDQVTYSEQLPIKLYIAGHTDTVAAADYNQRLSEKRALAIARYFRARGFSFPIFYKGFGERALKVPTADGVDEPANRRAEYVLSADPPHMDNVPRADQGWKRL